jgi:DNA (cytosine-5)-methyltransferase 1
MSDTKTAERLFDHLGGVEAPWYEGRSISEEKRGFFRERARRSREAKLTAESDPKLCGAHPINVPRLKPGRLMPRSDRCELVSLSLFSGGGGLDLGFDHAGFTHAASYDTLEAAGETLRMNRPDWIVKAGVDGDVRDVDWRALRGTVDVLHGGPPCQPFSIAGRQRGVEDERNMLPEFTRAVLEIRPSAFVMENVPAIMGRKFSQALREALIEPLGAYTMTRFELGASSFGVPQTRKRCFFVGFDDERTASRFSPPVPTHEFQGSEQQHLSGGQAPRRCLGAREALGLPAIGFDALAPTLRSTLTGPRHTTSILNSAAAQKAWAALRIWPNGVASTRVAAQAFPAENGHFRMSVADCAVLQGFPPGWEFSGAVYMALGQIGNSVAPPVAYRVARAVRTALTADPSGSGRA